MIIKGKISENFNRSKYIKIWNLITLKMFGDILSLIVRILKLVIILVEIKVEVICIEN